LPQTIGGARGSIERHRRGEFLLAPISGREDCRAEQDLSGAAVGARKKLKRATKPVIF
jgi:hypothetical protein